MTLVERARSMSAAAHEGQRYGQKPYTYHLEQVASVLRSYGLGQDEELIAAGYLHDSVEDTPLSLQVIRLELGEGVARLVDAVTDPPGRNRKERKAKAYPRIRAVPKAIMLKLADRIANTTECNVTGNALLLSMYQSEHPGMRAALFDPEGSAIEHRMWAELDGLLDSARIV